MKRYLNGTGSSWCSSLLISYLHLGLQNPMGCWCLPPIGNPEENSFGHILYQRSAETGYLFLPFRGSSDFLCLGSPLEISPQGSLESCESSP